MVYSQQLKIKIPILLIILFSLFFCQADNNYKVNHYEIKLRLDPVTQHLSVTTILTLSPEVPIPEKLLFYLHKQFAIHDISGRGVEQYSFDKETPNPKSWIPEGSAVVIDLQKESIGNKGLKLKFDYEGIISDWAEWSANVITEEWVELGLYLPWFPYNPEYGLFTFEIEVECDPEYNLRSFGKTKNENGKWQFKWTSPASDIVLVASKSLKTITRESEGKLINMHYSAIHDSTAKILVGDLVRILEFFESWFGGDKDGELTLIESLREEEAGMQGQV